MRTYTSLLLMCIVISFISCSAYSIDIPDAPLEPAVEKSAEKGMSQGSILEFWFLPRNKSFERFPVDPSVTGMVDESDKVFTGSSMLRDGELKQYVSRHGVLQWTSYFRAKKPGKHVFALGVEGMKSDNLAYGGVSMLVNDEMKVAAYPARDESVTVDFAGPGLYKIQIRMWWTHGGLGGSPLFQDYRASLKVREPGSIGLRQVTKKDLFYMMPE